MNVTGYSALGKLSQYNDFEEIMVKYPIAIPGGPQKNGTVDSLGLCSDQHLSFYTLLHPENDSPYKKLLINKKFSTKFDDLGVIYNEDKMFYPAR